LERLWKTDFESPEVDTQVCASLEDRRALEIMEGTVNIVNGPFLPNSKVVEDRRKDF